MLVAAASIVVLSTASPSLAVEPVSPARPSGDLILVGGAIYTMEADPRPVEAMVISAGKILYTGDADEALRYKSGKSRVIDVHGKVILPGLADAHVHPAAGEFLLRRLCDVRAFTVEEGFAKARHCARIAPAGDWVVGYGWYDLDNAGYDKVTLAQLDALVADRKLAILAKDMHSAWVNSKVLREFGITKGTPSPQGGEIVRDPATGEATGELLDAAYHPIAEVIQYHSPYALSNQELLKGAVAHLNSLGITSMVDALVDDDMANAYHELDLKGQLNMRVELAAPVSPSNYRTQIAHIAENRSRWQSRRVRLDFVKVFADGNPEVGLASFLNHDGPPETSTPGYYTQEQMTELVRLAEQAQLSVFVHVIGDGAVRQVLDAIAVARQASPETERRHTLTHLNWVSTADMPRFKAMNVIANIQEDWLAPSAFGGPPGYDYARSTAAGAIGPWLGGRTTPYRDLRDAGARIAAGSDWFYTEENPWRAMEAGITSKDPGGSNRQAMLPNYTLTLTDLLRARTSGAAYQMYREGEVGTLSVGKRADFIIIDRDPFHTPVEQIHETHVIATYLDGSAVYSDEPSR